MATSPIWKVYFEKEYRGSCKYVEDAACLVALLGNGATLRYDHTWIVWVEGREDQPAAESYDHVATVAHGRVKAKLDEINAKRTGKVTP